MTTTADELAWLVDRRSQIQAFLLRLHNLLEMTPPKAQAVKSVVLQLLLGAGFSLWRAVFLADRARSLETVDTHAVDFLSALIRDNAINYAQDKATRAWTVGYYINNAYFRMDLAYGKLGLATPLAATVKAFLKEQEDKATAVDAIEPWDNAHAAALEILEAVSTMA